MNWIKRIVYRKLPSSAIIQPGDIYLDNNNCYKTVRYANEEVAGWRVFGAEVYRLRWVREWRKWNVQKP